MKTSIRFFSGTGNTWRIALACQDAFQQAGHVADLQSILDQSALAMDADAACFCFPVYALDIPRIASAYIRMLPRPAKPVPSIVLVTGGSPDNCGWAVDTGVRLLAERGYPVQIGDLIQMPNNWTPFDAPPEPEESDRMVIRGIQQAAEITRRFLAGERCLKRISLKRFGTVGSNLIHTLFHRRGVYKLWMLYRATDACKGCGLCERICPTRSVKLVAGKPVWSITCEQCMRCVNFCPNRAIQQLEGLLHGSRHRAHHLAGFKPNENVSRG